MARLTLQARHARSCPLYPSTSFAKATKKDGCGCSPTYALRGWYQGKLTWEPVGQNRREAERALDARRGDVAKRTYRVLVDIDFATWAEQWLQGLSAKPSTARVYRHAIHYATETFGRSKVRDLTTGDVRRFLDTIRQANLDRHPDREVSPATLAKHLRALGACLQAAISEGYATENVVRGLHKTARPKVTKSRPSYFESDELPRLFAELEYRPVMAALIRTLVGTGCRIGELLALDWNHVDLLNGELHIGASFSELDGVTAPKSGQARTVDLVPATARVLEAWYAESGGEGLVFGREDGGHLTSSYVLRRVLVPAMKRAGIDRLGQRGGVRDVHSLRHTFARLALENGAPIDWVRRQLGHSSIVLTVDTYGEWSRVAQKAEAARLADAFPL